MDETCVVDEKVNSILDARTHLERDHRSGQASINQRQIFKYVTADPRLQCSMTSNKKLGFLSTTGNTTVNNINNQTTNLGNSSSLSMSQTANQQSRPQQNQHPLLNISQSQSVKNFSGLKQPQMRKLLESKQQQSHSRRKSPLFQILAQSQSSRKLLHLHKPSVYFEGDDDENSILLHKALINHTSDARSPAIREPLEANDQGISKENIILSQLKQSVDSKQRSEEEVRNSVKQCLREALSSSCSCMQRNKVHHLASITSADEEGGGSHRQTMHEFQMPLPQVKAENHPYIPDRLKTTECDELDTIIQQSTNLKSFEQQYLSLGEKRTKGMWPIENDQQNDQSLEPALALEAVQTTTESIEQRMDAMCKMYLAEKEKHHATKQVLDKAIDLASQLLIEIQTIENKSRSPTNFYKARPST